MLTCAVALLWAPRFRGPIDLRYDAGVYYVLGTSLAEGRGYRLLNEPGEIEAVQYPPLLPALVAGTQLALGTSDSVVVGRALRLAFLALSLAYALAGYALAREFLPPLPALLAAALATLHHFTFFLSDLCFAELPFGLVSVLFVIAVRRGHTGRAFTLGAAGFLLRTQGIALLGAWVGEALLRRRPKDAALRAGLALVPLLLWGVYVAHVTRSPAYGEGFYAYQRAPYQYYNVTYAENLSLLDPFRPEAGRLSVAALARRVAANLARLPLRFGEAASADWGRWEQFGSAAGRALGQPHALAAATRVPRAALGLLVLIGLIVLARRGEWLLPLYALNSYLLIAITPWPAQFARYLSPLTPFVGLALAVAAHRSWTRHAWPRRWVAPFAPAAAWLHAPRLSAAGAALVRPALLGLGLSALSVQAWTVVVTFRDFHSEMAWADRSGNRADGRLFYYGPEWRAYDQALDWLCAQAEPDGLLVTSMPHRAFLRTGRKAVMPPFVADPATEQRLLASVAGYVVVDGTDVGRTSRRYVEPAIAADPGPWTLVYDTAGVRIYRRRPSPTGSPAPADASPRAGRT